MEVVTKENKINILNKIKHKPILLESIFSFTEKRSYIIIDFISKDKSLKSNMKKFFDKAKQRNSLSKELNINIKKYAFYRKVFENNKLKEIINFKYTFDEFKDYFTQEITNNEKNYNKDSLIYDQGLNDEL